jgi:hypothetical protein
MREAARSLEAYMRAHVRMRREAGIAPSGYEYCCVEDYVLRNGAPSRSEPLTPDEEEIVREALERCREGGFEVHELKQCFANAQSLVMFGGRSELVYCEGYASGDACFPIHHGWVAVNGKVVDPTWTLETPADRGLLPGHPVGELPEHWAYWGAEFPDVDYLRARMLSREMIGTLLDDWESGHEILRGKSGVAV